MKNIILIILGILCVTSLAYNYSLILKVAECEDRLNECNDSLNEASNEVQALKKMNEVCMHELHEAKFPGQPINE
ncbi:hypothetical protein QQ054_29860 [Oscillatoria amoena NRMC-F 0135]|nr:hypothetical protein [Oscillatoria amoena NRMC-F 0135]